MSHVEFKGIIPLTLTIFDKYGEIDEKCNRDYLEFLITSGVHALFMVGSNGLGQIFSVEQRKYLAGISLDQINNRVPSIMHVGSPNCNISLKFAKHAEKLGASAVVSVPPYYYCHDKERVGYFY